MWDNETGTLKASIASQFINWSYVIMALVLVHWLTKKVGVKLNYRSVACFSGTIRELVSDL